MGSQTPKQYLDVADKPVLQQTLERLVAVERVSGVVVALSLEDGYWPDLPMSRHPLIRIVPGGKERADSVLSALEQLLTFAEPDDWVLVHDAARPCITVGDVNSLIDALKDHAVGGILAVPVSDTLKKVEAMNITDTLDRSLIWRAQTPQMFRLGALHSALIHAREQGWIVTDEASAMELQGYSPGIVEGRPDNIKITRPEDIALATFFLERQCYA